MIGKEINNLAKTLRAFDSTDIPMVSDISIINNDHVMALFVERADYTPILGIECENLGIECENVGIPVKDFKLIDKDDYTITFDDNKLSFVSDTTNLVVPTVEFTYAPVKLIQMEHDCILNVPIKELSAAIKEIAQIVKMNKYLGNYAYIDYFDGNLTISTSDRSTYRKILDCLCYSEPTRTIHAVYDINYLKKIISCIPAKTNVVMAFSSDCPIRIAWDTKEYRYGTVIAPVIQE